MSRVRWILFLMLCLASRACPLAAEQASAGLSGRLAYSRLTNGTWQIWQTDLSSGTRTQVTFSSGDKRDPAWTPDGRISYCAADYRCFVVRINDRQEEPLLNALWPVRDLAWSRAGAQLAFAKVHTDLVDSANLWVAEVDNENRRILTHDAGLQYNPSWSADGKQVVYVASHGYKTGELYVLNLDGSSLKQLTANQARELLPAWSPDGAKIAYTSDASGDYEIWVMDADGSHVKQLTHSPGLDTRAAWSPDSTKIAFTTNRSGTLEIWVMNADGSNPQLLEHAEGGVCDPAWQ